MRNNLFHTTDIKYKMFLKSKQCCKSLVLEISLFFNLINIELWDENSFLLYFDLSFQRVHIVEKNASGF